MPKILVAFCSRTGTTARVAAALAHGAEHVRFSEVDVRLLRDGAPASVVGSVPAWAAARRELEQRYSEIRADDVVGYDGVILAATARDGRLPNEIDAFIDGLRSTGSAFANVVTSTFIVGTGADRAAGDALTALATLGGIIVPASAFDSANADASVVAAKQLGNRVAKLVGWVTHGLGHEQGHAHHHHH